MGYTNYLKNNLQDAFWRGAALVRPTTIYVGLSTTAPNDAGGNITEPSGNGYARVAVANSSTTWAASAAGSTISIVDVLFPNPIGGWGTVGWFFYSDALTGGNILEWAALTTARLLDASSVPVRFVAGDLRNILSP